MQLELTEVPALLVNLNARAEKHGEENTPAGDIKLRAQRLGKARLKAVALDRKVRPQSTEKKSWDTRYQIK